MDPRRNDRGGFTLLETLVAMTIFTIGVLGLAQVQLAASRSNTGSRATTTASLLASDRLEECVHAPAYDGITAANYGSEDYGSVESSDPRFKPFKRSVSIVDSLDVTGRSSLKTITVRVDWRTRRGEREIRLSSRVARY